MRRFFLILIMVCSLTLPAIAQQYPGITAGPQTLQSAATTGLGSVLNVNGRAAELTVVVQGTGTTSGGVIKIEEAYWSPTTSQYTGTWSVIATLTAGTEFTSNTQTVYHTSAPAAFWKVRARISSDITGGGTVTVTAWTN